MVEPTVTVEIQYNETHAGSATGSGATRRAPVVRLAVNWPERRARADTHGPRLLGGHVGPWGPYAPRGRAVAKKRRSVGGSPSFSTVSVSSSPLTHTGGGIGLTVPLQPRRQRRQLPPRRRRTGRLT